MNTLVTTKGLFIGDILFASSLAPYYQADEQRFVSEENNVDFRVEFLQPIELLNNHPQIRKAYFNEQNDSYDNRYDEVIELNPLSTQDIPATLQFQTQAGIPKQLQKLGYEVHTNPSTDYVVNKFFNQERSKGKIIVAYQANWEEKSFGFTREEYERGIDVPNLGYGGRRRDINMIIETLKNDPKIFLVPVGQGNGISQRNMDIYSATSFAFTASLINQSDFLIGSEGGITNLGAGVNTKCIITTDFIWQLYGPNGCIRKLDKLTMGPATYFPHRGHIHIDPFATDREVIDVIKGQLK
jgi:hypothetical protein